MYRNKTLKEEKEGLTNTVQFGRVNESPLRRRTSGKAFENKE